MTIEEILKQEHAFSPDGEKLYTADGNTYRVSYDCDYGTEITDYQLISEYNKTNK